VRGNGFRRNVALGEMLLRGKSRKGKHHYGKGCYGVFRGKSFRGKFLGEISLREPTLYQKFLQTNVIIDFFIS
jgi:hypothetical protein